MKAGLLSIGVNICRLIVALTFIFSGYVKAIDPLGTQYKINDYLQAAGLGGLLPGIATLSLSVLLSALEFFVGILLLFAINRRIISRVALVFMAVMTAVTFWLWVANPISDCGCFGDAVHLTNGQTLLKNLVLLGCTIVIAWKPLKMVRFISKSNQWIVMNYTALFIILSSVWCLYDLPVFDFRPYHIGANIPESMAIPDDAEQPQFETTFIMEKEGVRKEFTLDNYPDSTWTFIDSKSVQVKEGYVPPIHDFSITTLDEGEDITEDVINRQGYSFLLIAPHLEEASDTNFGEIDQLYEYAQGRGYPFYCLTASGEEAIDRWRDLTGAEYPFCTTDEITLKTIIRSNPGLVLIKDGTIIRKWSHNHLPVIEPAHFSVPLEKFEIGEMPQDSVPQKILAILVWFALPLFLLTLADRAWAWTQWLRRKPVAKDSPNEDNKNTPSET